MEIANLIAEQNAQKIKGHYSNMTDYGNFNVNKMWLSKKKILPTK